MSAAEPFNSVKYQAKAEKMSTTISTSKRSNSKSSATATESATSSGASIPSDAGYAAGISADDFASFDGVIADYSYDHSTPASTTVQQSIQIQEQESIQTDVGRAAGMSDDWRAIAEDNYDEGRCNEPEEVVGWDDEKSGRVGGGANDDSASLEVSAITSMRSAYTPVASHRPTAVNKLQFSSLGLLHGREKEVELLRGCFDRFVAKKKLTEESNRPSSVGDNSSEVVFISGESGTGKVSKRVTGIRKSIKTALRVESNPLFDSL